MAEIVDVLVPKYLQCPEFTIDVDADYVTVSATDAIMYVSGASSLIHLFQSRDNIRLVSVGFYIPEGFSLSDTPKNNLSLAANELQLVYCKSDESLGGNLPGLGQRGVVAIPFPNYEMTLDLFSNMSGASLLADNLFCIKASLYCNNISMIGIPAKLDNKTIKVIPFIKILHTLPIIGGGVTPPVADFWWEETVFTTVY